MTQKKIKTILKAVKFEIDHIKDIRETYSTLKNVLESINSIYSTDMEQKEKVDNLMNKIVIVMTLVSSNMRLDEMYSLRMIPLTFNALNDMRKAAEFIDNL